MTISNPQRVGNVGGTPIVAELGGGLSPDRLATVTLSADYTMEKIPGFPSRPPAGGATPKALPKVIASGSTVQFLVPEAAALVAAGAATYA